MSEDFFTSLHLPSTTWTLHHVSCTVILLLYLDSLKFTALYRSSAKEMKGKRELNKSWLLHIWHIKEPSTFWKISQSTQNLQDPIIYCAAKITAAY